MKNIQYIQYIQNNKKFMITLTLATLIVFGFVYLAFYNFNQNKSSEITQKAETSNSQNSNEKELQNKSENGILQMLNDYSTPNFLRIFGFEMDGNSLGKVLDREYNFNHLQNNKVANYFTINIQEQGNNNNKKSEDIRITISEPNKITGFNILQETEVKEEGKILGFPFGIGYMPGSAGDYPVILNLTKALKDGKNSSGLYNYGTYFDIGNGTLLELNFTNQEIEPKTSWLLKALGSIRKYDNSELVVNKISQKAKIGNPLGESKESVTYNHTGDSFYGFTFKLSEKYYQTTYAKLGVVPFYAMCDSNTQEYPLYSDRNKQNDVDVAFACTDVSLYSYTLTQLTYVPFKQNHKKGDFIGFVDISKNKNSSIKVYDKNRTIIIDVNKLWE
jgi:hypothetical protein